ncbi:MAG: class I SAM-dependent methyltransferase [Mariprofundaceae bacterium]|nr:class I SAM-dependent methyltransferase [Mariprofundaceae bacterium]
MAHHKAFSKQRWSVALKAELALCSQLRQKNADLNSLKELLKERYIPLIEPHISNLQEDSQILELGCGPACVCQFIKLGKKTFLDPLLDDFRRAWPGSLPKGTFITEMAENIKAPDASYDCIVCLKTLSYVQNPELILHETERLLKPDGSFIISVELWPSAFAKLHYFTAKFFPQRTLKNRLYCYTKHGLENTLKRHFNIHSSQHLPSTEAFSLKDEWLYICTPLKHP